MTKKSGLRLDARRPSAMPWMIAVVAVVLVAIGAFAWTQHRKEAAAKAAQWTLAGPACPIPSKAQLAAMPAPAWQTMTLDENEISRASGAMSCDTIAYNAGKGLDHYFDKVTVCQFASPMALRIRTAKGEFHFAPPAGKSATVSIRDGAPGCVMATNVVF